MSKNETHLDPRVRRTRKLLLDALMELIPEKGYNAITIQDITDRATLNRATFYLHYRDKDDLLYQGMHETLNELHSRQPVPVLEQDRLTMNESITTVVGDFEHIAMNADFYRAMLGESGATEFTLKLKNLVLKTTEQRLKSALGELPSGPLPTELVLEFMASGYVGLIRWWLENDMPYTPEEIARQLIHLYAMGCYNALGMEADMGKAG
jgi:AcrR family transcriptional regulator